MIDVNYGWLVRYAHSNGAGFFFIFVYMHMARGIYYGSYRKLRVALWTIGVIIFLVMIITAFLGYKNNSPKSFIYNKCNNIKYPINKKNIRFIHTNRHIKDSTELIKILSELGLDNILNYWDNLNKLEVLQNIQKTVANKSGIYIIINKITRNKYVGSAITNRLYSRFSKHLINLNGSKLIKKAIKQEGLNNFIYGILEYYLDKINKENNKDLLLLETSYLTVLTLEYNILLEAFNSFGYKHSEDSLLKMRESFTKERRELLRKLQESRKGNWSENSKLKLREIALNRLSNYITVEGSNKISQITFGRKYVSLYNEENNKICHFRSINKTKNYLCCSTKTIKRAINLGWIYILVIFIKYLSLDYIDNNNSIKDILINLNLKFKSSLILRKNIEYKKFIIKN